MTNSIHRGSIRFPNIIACSRLQGNKSPNYVYQRHIPTFNEQILNLALYLLKEISSYDLYNKMRFVNKKDKPTFQKSIYHDSLIYN